MSFLFWHTVRVFFGCSVLCFLFSPCQLTFSFPDVIDSFLEEKKPVLYHNANQKCFCFSCPDFSPYFFNILLVI